ncbi:hypothetical protein BABINDRAFT_160632 [Babjeviella inositovora NRRL Y-12698]|uniref:Mediator of RNA polymerase II transcription subunit 18 n=1 Tax=Babjeviella inositovora NRRL Y-12698 TaxID=984486 RepID=A0A1E3QW93_9ASCO|nr:uncharacterized protein BABINDRAFT_160632 [Babjeviella inositovora NRRL Y-12698]ODQ81257.1 hypothetical protein BABINDRAFT_160632 [Babjeviella inositovora NRRL Y-12698]
MAPLPVRVHTLLAMPYLKYYPKVEPGKVNQIEMCKIRVQREWTLADWEDHTPQIRARSVVHNERLGNDVWTIQLSDIPLAGKRSTTSQAIYESTITSGNVLPYLTVLGYKMETEFWVQGHRFFHNRIIIELTRIFVANTETFQREMGERENKTPEKIPLQLLDRSGQFLVRAYVNVAKMTDVDALSRANTELLLLQAELAGLFDLAMPDRMCMDGRVATVQEKP